GRGQRLDANRYWQCLQLHHGTAKAAIEDQARGRNHDLACRRGKECCMQLADVVQTLVDDLLEVDLRDLAFLPEVGEFRGVIVRLPYQNPRQAQRIYGLVVAEGVTNLLAQEGVRTVNCGFHKGVAV